jgi:dTDP-4-amino-4,6-dideoxygalactose transaminase
MDGVMTFAAEHDLLVIEDAAQSIGASWAGRLTGTIGQLGCSNNAALAQRVRSLRNHGQRERYVHDELGFNYRMDGLQAACKLKLLASWTSERKAQAKVYDRMLAELPLELPKVVNQDYVWHPYVVRTPQRNGLRNHLQAHGIETDLHYPVPLHRQPCLARYASARFDFSEADRWANQGLTLLLFVGMTSSQQAARCDYNLRVSKRGDIFTASQGLHRTHVPKNQAAISGQSLRSTMTPRGE